LKEIKQTFIALLKAKRIDISDEFTFNIYWEMVKDFPKDKLLTAIKKAMVTKYPFFEIADLIELVNGGNEDNQRIEKEWAECLASAKSGGSKQISARAGKAINSLGGIKWLGNNDPKDVSFNKRDFIASYKNTPEPIDNDFRCPGLVAPMYLDHIEQSLRDAVNSLDSNIKQLEG